jgi:hypothetical protein
MDDCMWLNPDSKLEMTSKTVENLDVLAIVSSQRIPWKKVFHPYIADC